MIIQKKTTNEKRCSCSRSEKERGENGGVKRLGEILSNKGMTLSRRIERNIKGIIIECANGGTPYVEDNISRTESKIPRKKRKKAIYYCWIVHQNGHWDVSEKRLVERNGIIVVLKKRLFPGGKIKIKQSFCGTAFASVLRH